eukprot:6087740-Amphidinium_carterae.1
MRACQCYATQGANQNFGPSSRLMLFLALGCLLGIVIGALVGYEALVYRQFLTHYWLTTEANEI